jgi:hypothetical protein
MHTLLSDLDWEELAPTLIFYGGLTLAGIYWAVRRYNIRWPRRGPSAKRQRELDEERRKVYARRQKALDDAASARRQNQECKVSESVCPH